MMEIVYGPLILACAGKSLAFGILVAAALPLVEAALSARAGQRGLVRRLGLGLLSGGLFGLAHLALVCAADGYPPRIIQSTALAMAIVAAAGLTLLVVRRPATAGN
ncbi:MAG: hypothetical protein SFW09_18705 [Hyphomicrobiaceae bacterium]|nr:hypothetical protein [Hyphomicrobiaceae bacterium]